MSDSEYASAEEDYASAEEDENQSPGQTTSLGQTFSANSSTPEGEKSTGQTTASKCPVVETGSEGKASDSQKPKGPQGRKAKDAKFNQSPSDSKEPESQGTTGLDGCSPAVKDENPDAASAACSTQEPSQQNCTTAVNEKDEQLEDKNASHTEPTSSWGGSWGGLWGSLSEVANKVSDVANKVTEDVQTTLQAASAAVAATEDSSDTVAIEEQSSGTNGDGQQGGEVQNISIGEMKSVGYITKGLEIFEKHATQIGNAVAQTAQSLTTEETQQKAWEAAHNAASAASTGIQETTSVANQLISSLGIAVSSQLRQEATPSEMDQDGQKEDQKACSLATCLVVDVWTLCAVSESDAKKQLAKDFKSVPVAEVAIEVLAKLSQAGFKGIVHITGCAPAAVQSKLRRWFAHHRLQEKASIEKQHIHFCKTVPEILDVCRELMQENGNCTYIGTLNQTIRGNMEDGITVIMPSAEEETLESVWENVQSQLSL